jgi:hypothetical protein
VGSQQRHVEPIDHMTQLHGTGGYVILRLEESWDLQRRGGKLLSVVAGFPTVLASC